MAVPTLITELSTTAASNSPAGGDSAATADDFLRAHAAFIAQLYAGTSNGQIVFPATQNASTNANTLDDYEEGTFTPTDASGAGLTLAEGVGRYIKIGKRVFVDIKVTYPATADATAAKLGGLPFTSVNAVTAGGGPCVWTNSVCCAWYADGNSTSVILIEGAAPDTYPTNADLSGRFLLLTGSYEATA